MAKVSVKQPEPPAEEIPAEVIASAIVSISEGMRVLRNSRLTEEAILLLVQNAMPVKDRPSRKQIQATLHAMGDLRRIYLK
jgi:hypothetical protein